MGLIQLFTNPAGFLADKVKEKVQDKAQDRFKSMPGMAQIGKVAEGATKGISQVGSKLGQFGAKREEFLGGLMEKALGGGEAQAGIMEQISDIQGRELPTVDEYKPAGKAAEWMNRLGAGLYAAGGGNPEDIYRNFRAKEETKLARHTRQQESRQAAIESQDREVLGALEGIAGRGQQAATSISANILQQQTSMQLKGAEAQIRSFENEADMAKTVLGFQADFEVQRQGHIDRIQELDKQGQMDIERIDHAAAMQMRNDMNSELLALGVNPAGFENTVNAYSRGDFGNMTGQDHVRLQLLGNMKKAVTDEDLRMAKLGALTQVMGTRVHARDENTGSQLYDIQGQPVYTTLSTAESAATYIWGSKQDALDSFRNNDLGAETRAAQQFAEGAGMVTPSPFHPQAMDPTDLATRGFPSTEDGAFSDMPEDPRDGREQARNSAGIWNTVAGDLDKGHSMREVVQALKDSGAASEMIQMTMQRAMEFGYWDGQEERDEIMQIITMGAEVPPTGGVM